MAVCQCLSCWGRATGELEQQGHHLTVFTGSLPGSDLGSSAWGAQSSPAAYVALRAPVEVTEGHCSHSHEPTQLQGEETQIPFLDGNSVKVT